MILKDTATFQVLFIVSLSCAWNITTVEISSGVYVLKRTYGCVAYHVARFRRISSAVYDNFLFICEEIHDTKNTKNFWVVEDFV